MGSIKADVSPRRALWEMVNDLDDWVNCGYRRDVRFELPPAGTQGAGAQGAGGATAESAAESAAQLRAVEQEVAGCTLCGLHKERKNTVPGTGAVGAVQVMVVGEAPGRDEDHQGLPFVGAAGQYLDKWLAAIGLSRDRGVYITNTVKCRPPGNRDPREEETAQCMPYLLRQISILKPRAILCAGRISASILLERPVRIGAERGKWFRFMNIPLIATYHPSAVLRNPDLRRPVWDDLQKLRESLESGNF